VSLGNGFVASADPGATGRDFEVARELLIRSLQRDPTRRAARRAQVGYFDAEHF
jgi:hypothetical protein